MWRILATAGLACVLTACDVDSTFEIYSRDVNDLITNEDMDEVPVASTILVEVPSRSDCVDKKNTIVEIVSGYFEEVRNTRCTEVDSDMQNFLRLDARTAMIAVEREADEFPEALADRGLLFAFAVGINQHDLQWIRAHLDHQRMATLNDELREQFPMMSGSNRLALGRITYKFRNDRRETVAMSTVPSYVDGEPVPSTNYWVELGPRDSAEVELSDVYVDGLSAYGSGYHLWIDPIPTAE